MTTDRTRSTGLIEEACPLFDGPVLRVEPDTNEQWLGMRHFLGWWFARCDPAWFMDLRAFTRSKKDPPWTKRVPLGDLDTATDILLRWNAERCVYFSACPRKSADASARRGEGVAAVPGFWLDIDKERPDIVPGLRGFTQPPDHIVHSGHGYHAYWRFDAPVPATSELKRRLRVLARVLEGDVAVCEFARIMRVPFSWNRKRDPHVQARIVP